MIQSSLTDRVKNQLSLFEHSDPVVEQMTNDLWDQLELSEFSLSCGWNEEEVQIAATQVISWTVYPASELRM